MLELRADAEPAARAASTAEASRQLRRSAIHVVFALAACVGLNSSLWRYAAVLLSCDVRVRMHSKVPCQSCCSSACRLQAQRRRRWRHTW